MADTVNVPGAGKQSKKTVTIVAIGTVGVVAFMWFKHKSAGSASASSASTSASIDPSTGYPYGSAQDQAALAAQSGSSSDTIDPATGAVYGSQADEQALAQESGSAGGIGYGSTAINGVTSFTTNSEWAQQCESVVPPLINSTTAQSDVAAAIGRFLAGLPLTEEQAQIIQVCESEEGPPPVGQFSIIPEPATSPPSSGTPTDVTVPDVVGQSAGDAHNLLVQANLDPTAPKGQTPNMKVSRTSPTAGTQVAKGSKVAIYTSGYVK